MQKPALNKHFFSLDPRLRGDDDVGWGSQLRKITRNWPLSRATSGVSPVAPCSREAGIQRDVAPLGATSSYRLPKGKGECRGGKPERLSTESKSVGFPPLHPAR